MSSKPTKPKYWTPERILQTNAEYYMIIGPRSNGKTYGCLNYMLKEYFSNGSEFAIIRRWADDFKGKRGSIMFAALENNDLVKKYSNNMWTNIMYQSGRFYLSRYEDGKLVHSEQPIGYSFAISQMEHDKSTSYPNVNNILFDEFLTRSDYGYLNNEFVLFMNTLSTIIRDRDYVKIFMCANTVNFTSPYFSEMGLTNIKKMQPGDIDIYNYGDSSLRVAVEYADVAQKKSGSNKFFAFNNPRLKMITGSENGSWEIDIYPHLPFKYKPADVLLMYFIQFEGETFQAEVIEANGCMITYIHRKTTELRNPDDDLVFNPNIDPRPNWFRNILKITNPKIAALINKTLTRDNTFYQDNEVGEYIRNYLQWCKQS